MLSVVTAIAFQSSTASARAAIGLNANQPATAVAVITRFIRRLPFIDAAMLPAGPGVGLASFAHLMREYEEQWVMPGKTLSKSDPHPLGVTQLLRAWSDGEEAALNQLMPLVEAELRRVARAYMRRERHDHTLQATALVNEVFLRLTDGQSLRLQDRSHFLGIAARLMRRVLVDHARSRRYQKRGGGAVAVSLDEALLAAPERTVDLVALDHALDAFALVDARKSRVVELRFFGGLSLEETADVLHVSVETVKRDWRVARLWLLRELRGEPRHPPAGAT
ncbi:MAG: sigma-70 family RNA polymerase sigma factor [Acidobacteriota bacterium]